MEDIKLPDIKTWRKKYGLSQKKLADLMRVSLATFRGLELGRGRKPQKRTLKKLADTIDEIEQKAAKPASAKKIETAAKLKKVTAAPAPVEKPKKQTLKSVEPVKKPIKQHVKTAEVVKHVEPELPTEPHVEITNLDLELINRILKLSSKEKLELLQRLL